MKKLTFRNGSSITLNPARKAPRGADTPHTRIEVEVCGRVYTYLFNNGGYEINNNDPAGIARQSARAEWERQRLAEYRERNQERN